MKVIMVDSLVGNDYTLCLCQGLADAGLDVTLVTAEGRKVDQAVFTFPIFATAPPKDSRKSPIAKFFHYLWYLKWLASCVRRPDVDVVHCQFFRRERLESLFFALLHLLGVKLVYTAHNVLPHEHSGIDYYLKSLVYRSAHKIIVHSAYIKNKLLDNFTIDPQKIEIVPHGNFDIYLPDKVISKEEARQQLDFSMDDQLLLFFGYIREYKGLDVLLDAFDLAKEHNPHLKLVIAGKPYMLNLEKAYRRHIEQLTAKESVLFSPNFVPTDQVATYFTAADIVVLPYKKIDHSGIVHLAYSFGRPIIATNVGDFKEMISQDQSGYLVPEESATALAQAIKTAFKDKHQLTQMGQNAQQLSQTKYSWGDIALKTKTIYHKLLS